MTLRANDTWGQIITTPTAYYTTTDAPALAVSSTKEVMDIAIGHGVTLDQLRSML